MTRKQVGIALLVAGIIGLLVYAIATRPSLDAPESAPVATEKDPLAAPLIEHMLEAGVLDASDQPNAELAITRRDGKVHIHVSERLLERLGPGALEKLELLAPEETMSWNRYHRFLDRLHDAIVETLPEEHRHEHH
jgi:hypothetical protein